MGKIVKKNKNKKTRLISTDKDPQQQNFYIAGENTK